ncbi:MAG TPA: hypothetical protein VMU07_04165 [Candidatus Paceibacterota bacterium]|nr:hypothetical protein [Candidatus Paceibacterota bacterium]
MSTELFKLTLAFRGLSDEDEEDTGIDDPETLDDDDDDDEDLALGSDDGDDDAEVLEE